VACSGLKDIQKSALNGHVCLALVDLDKDARAVLSEVSVLKAQHEYLRVVTFGDQFVLEELLTAIASGADCYLMKNEISADTLLKSLELVLLGGTIVPQGFARLLRTQAHLQQEALSPGNCMETPLEDARPHYPLKAGDILRLSGREQVILSHLTQGASNKHIARELKISEATVKTYVKGLLRKIDARNRTQAAMWAVTHFEARCCDEPEPSVRSAAKVPLFAQFAQVGIDRG
jgi:two-component system nitrate/nitrite response regulator NarL